MCRVTRCLRLLVTFCLFYASFCYVPTEHTSQEQTKRDAFNVETSNVRYSARRVDINVPIAAVSVLLCANSNRFRPWFSHSILCIVPWYSDRVRSTESRMSLTVALKISFKEDSSRIFRSLDVVIFHSEKCLARM